MMQMGRNMTDEGNGMLAGKRKLIIDRDTKYCQDFRQLVESSGTSIIRLPPRSPNLKAYASHCTSCERIGLSAENKRRCESFDPWDLVGGLSPGCAYRNSLLSL